MIFLLFAGRAIVAIRIFGIGITEIMNARYFVLSFILELKIYIRSIEAMQNTRKRASELEKKK